MLSLHPKELHLNYLIKLPVLNSMNCFHSDKSVILFSVCLVTPCLEHLQEITDHDVCNPNDMVTAIMSIHFSTSQHLGAFLCIMDHESHKHMKNTALLYFLFNITAFVNFILKL